MTMAFNTSLRTLLLGSDSKLRLRASQTLLAWAVYVVFASGQFWLARAGLIDARASGTESLFAVGGASIFFLLVRTRALGHVFADPGLVVPQMLWALGCTSWAYGINGPVRGSVLLLMMLIFQYGMFSLSTTQARRVSLSGFTMLAGVMAWKCTTDPVAYDPLVELSGFLSAGTVFAAVTMLASRFGRLRAALQVQRRELTQALERIQILATRDELTGLTNRRAILERMHGDLAVRGRSEPTMTMALLDIDHFKSVNDTHGHAAGDAVLRRFSEEASAIVRAGDMLARWGGEEFLLVMPATRPADALNALARLRLLLRSASFDGIAPGLRVTFSGGITACRGGDDIETAIERADAAMYEAKRTGRDRSLLADADTEGERPVRVPASMA